jgi:predicted PurR-regulated permease PerM
MSLQRQMLFWLGALLVLLTLLYLLREVLLPFVAGLVLAYLLDPVADRLKRIGIGRFWAVFLILILFIVLFILALIVLIPLLGGQLVAFVGAVPGYIARLHASIMATLSEMPDNPVAEYLATRMGDARATITQILAESSTWVARVLSGVWSGGAALLNVLALLVVTPIVAFYILVDWDRLTATIDKILPRRHAETIRGLGKEIDGVVAGFIRGQATICLILATYYGVGLTMTGLNFGLLIGVSAGLLSFIPYVGSISGLVIAVGVAIVQFGPLSTALALVVAVFLIGQILESYVLYPKLVGESVGLHPVWLMFSLVAFGALFGFVGLLIAVPVSAAIGVLVRFGLRRYMESPFYTGDPRPAQADTPRP